MLWCKLPMTFFELFFIGTQVCDELSESNRGINAAYTEIRIIKMLIARTEISRITKKYYNIIINIITNIIIL